MEFSIASIKRMLADFRKTHFAQFQTLASNTKTGATLLGLILEELRVCESQEWIDDEHIAFLGRDIERASPKDFYMQLAEEIKVSHLKESTRSAFFSLATQGQPEVSSSGALPSLSEFQKTIQEIESAEEAWDPFRATDLLDKYLSYLKATGDSQLVGYSISAIIQAALKNPKINFRIFHAIVDTTIQEVFSIEATDERLWVCWASSFVRIGQPKEASIVLWEAIRRRPDSAHLAFALLKVLERSKYNYQNRIRFAQMAASRFHFNRHLSLEHCRLLGYSSIPEQALLGIQQLTDMIARTPIIKFESVSLSSIVSKQWSLLEQSGKQTDVLEYISTKLKKKPGLIGSISYRLDHDHKRRDIAVDLVATAAANATDELELERFDNARAKVIASSGTQKDLTTAISILEGHHGPISQNHRARLLVLRNRNGDWQQAEKILRDRLEEAETDYFAISQLAGLLVNYGTNRVAEALELLQPHTSENPWVKELYTKISAGEFVRLGEEIGVEVKDSISETDQSDEDPTGVTTLTTHKSLGELPFELNPDVRRDGEIRRLKFEIDYGTTASANSARVSLESYASEAHSPYLSFVSEEYNLPFKSQNEIGKRGAEIVQFAVHGDSAALSRAARETPRMISLVRFSQAVNGDTESREFIEQVSASDVRLFPWERQLISGAYHSRFGQNLLKFPAGNKGKGAQTEFRRRFSDLVGAVVTLESFAA